MPLLTFYEGSPSDIIGAETFSEKDIEDALQQAARQFPSYIFVKHQIMLSEGKTTYAIKGTRIEGHLEETILEGLRPCLVKGHKALFHRWSAKAWPVAPSMMVGGPPGGQMSMTLALVEYENGIVHEAYPYEIVFTDKED